jgi:hypothetical protein
MANSDSTSSTIAPNGVNRYSTQSPLFRAEMALEMATEISDRSSQHYALASVISSTLAPSEQGEELPDWTVYRLAKLLEGVMADHAQMNRLLECLTVTRDALVQDGGAA